MNILVIGAGMYVTGREGTGTGTILSSLAELSRSLSLEVTVVATRAENEQAVADAAARINTTLGTSLPVCYRTISGDAAVDIPLLCAPGRFSAAIVSVPDHLHFAYTRALLEQGIPPLVVKPLTPTLAEARELVRLQESAGLYGAVEFHKRWDQTNLWIRRALSENKLGRLLYFTVDYSQKISMPTVIFQAWAGHTNIFQYLGVHYVDLIYFLTGAQPRRALAIGTSGVLKELGIDTWDSVHATICWETSSGEPFVSQFSTNWIDPACTSAMSDQKYKVIGTRGRIECDQKNRGLEFVSAESGVQQVNPYFSDYLPGEDGDLHFSGYGYASIACFIRDVADLRAGRADVKRLELCRPTLRHSLVSTAVVDAVNRSLLAGGCWETVDATI